MSNDQYETNRLRARAVIATGQGTAKELGGYLLPDQPEHQAHVRANGWLREDGPKCTNPNVFLRWLEWTNRKWDVKGKKLTELKNALKTQ